MTHVSSFEWKLADKFHWTNTQSPDREPAQWTRSWGVCSPSRHRQSRSLVLIFLIIGLFLRVFILNVKKLDFTRRMKFTVRTGHMSAFTIHVIPILLATTVTIATAGPCSPFVLDRHDWICWCLKNSSSRFDAFGRQCNVALLLRFDLVVDQDDGCARNCCKSVVVRSYWLGLWKGRKRTSVWIL